MDQESTCRWDHTTIAILSVLALWVVSLPAGAQCPGSGNTQWGTDFWLAWPSSAGAAAKLTLLADDPVEVEVTMPACVPSVMSRVVEAGNPWQVSVCGGSHVTTSEAVVSNKYIRARALDPADPPFVAVFRSPDPPGTLDDAYLGIPSSDVGSMALFRDYDAMGDNGFGAGSRYTLVATEPVSNLSYEDCAGITSVIPSLNPGDIFQVICDDPEDDLTGRRVQAESGKFLFIGGSERTLIPDGIQSADTLHASLPAVHWHKDRSAPPMTRYWTTPIPEGPSANPRDRVRILNLDSSENIIRIRLSGGGAGEPEEERRPPFGASDQPCFVTATADPFEFSLSLGGRGSSNSWCDLDLAEATLLESDSGPFAVAEYAHGTLNKFLGDPHEMFMVPEHRWTCDYRFWSEPMHAKGQKVSILVPEAARDCTMLDGSTIPAASWTLMPSPDGTSLYYYTMQEVSDGEHTVVGCDGAGESPVGVYVHGYDSAGSYAYPAGMDMGQNTPPDCAIGIESADCGVVGLRNDSTDIDGDELVSEWSVSGCDAVLTPDPEGLTATLTFSDLCLAESCQVSLEVDDGFGGVSMCSISVDNPVDNTPPDITGLGPNDETCIHPPNHKMVCFDDLTADVVATDDCPGEVTFEVTGCSSNQASMGPGSGPFKPDCTFTETGVCVRAERDGRDENGRTYTVDITARDACGNESTEGLELFVPHDQRTDTRCD